MEWRQAAQAHGVLPDCVSCGPTRSRIGARVEDPWCRASDLLWSGGRSVPKFSSGLAARTAADRRKNGIAGRRGLPEADLRNGCAAIAAVYAGCAKDSIRSIRMDDHELPGSRAEHDPKGRGQPYCMTFTPGSHGLRGKVSEAGGAMCLELVRSISPYCRLSNKETDEIGARSPSGCAQHGQGSGAVTPVQR